MNTVHLKYGLSGLKGYLDYMEGVGVHGKVEKIGVDPMSISPDNPLVQMNFVPLI